MGTGFLMGFLSTAAFAGSVVAFRHWLWPLYLANRYRGIVVAGEWDGYYEGIDERCVRFSFEQAGHRLKGTSRVELNKSRNRVERSYSYQGTVLGQSLVIKFEDRSHLTGGAMVLHIANSDATILRGESIYYKPESGCVETTRLEMRKVTTP